QVAPGQPTGLTATAVSATQVDLAWTAATGTVDRYRIERKTGVAGTYALIDSVAGGMTAYANTGLTATTEYFYRVEACNTAGCSAYSIEASATTPADAVSASASNAEITLPSPQPSRYLRPPSRSLQQPLRR
ncbi:MAG: fibronectin type III domain-containing protein, partial [Gemmatimonadota bacterium]